jgi:hypothetical protein
VAAMAILLNASESIAVKTNFLDKLVMMFVCMFPLLRRGCERSEAIDVSAMQRLKPLSV